MSDKNLMQHAREEIIRLRRENEVLRARVETMELFATVLHTKPFMPSIGETEDIAWSLAVRVSELEVDDLAAAS